MADGFEGLSREAARRKVEEIAALAALEGGWLHSASGIASGNNQECVSLARSVTAGLDHVSSWREGERLDPSVVDTLAPGTLVATFNNGRYGKRGGGQHVGVFTRKGENEKGVQGIYLLDQHRPGRYENGEVKERFYPFVRDRKYQVGDFSTVAK